MDETTSQQDYLKRTIENKELNRKRKKRKKKILEIEKNPNRILSSNRREINNVSKTATAYL